MPSSRPEQQIITELKKQYEVVQVDPTNPITERYDVLVAVQPSSPRAAADDELRGGHSQRPAGGDL